MSDTTGIKGVAPRSVPFFGTTNQEEPLPPLSATQNIAREQLSETDLTSSTHSIQPESITPPPESFKKVREAANPAIATIEAVLGFERRSTDLLEISKKDSDTYLKIMNLLLDLSRDLSQFDENAKIEFSEKMKTILDDLKGKGIDLLNETTTISKSQLIELKSAIGLHLDKSRTEVQRVFATMQTIIQEMMSVNDSGKKIISELAQFIHAILRNMRP